MLAWLCQRFKYLASQDLRAPCEYTPKYGQCISNTSAFHIFRGTARRGARSCLVKVRILYYLCPCVDLLAAGTWQLGHTFFFRQTKLSSCLGRYTHSHDGSRCLVPRLIIISQSSLTGGRRTQGTFRVPGGAQVRPHETVTTRLYGVGPTMISRSGHGFQAFKGDVGRQNPLCSQCSLRHRCGGTD